MPLRLITRAQGMSVVSGLWSHSLLLHASRLTWGDAHLNPAVHHSCIKSSAMLARAPPSTSQRKIAKTCIFPLASSPKLPAEGTLAKV